MLSFKRALMAAALFITLFYLLTRSHAPVDPSVPIKEELYPNPDKLPESPKKSSSTTGTPETGGKTDGNGNAAGAGGAGGSGGPGGPGGSTGQKMPQDMSKMSTYEKLAYQYPYDVETKFPAYIWQTWKYTPADGKFIFREEEASWTQLHPGFIHEVITDDVADNLIKIFYASVPEVLEAYDAMPLPVLKADFFRYLILLARGGVYSDIDTAALRSTVEWVPDSVPSETIGLVIGIEADPDRPDWHEWYSRRIQFCQWTIQSKPGHPVMRDVVARITAETLRKKRSNLLTGFLDKNVIEFTGPAIWTDTIFEYFNDPRFFDMSTSKGAIDWQNFTGMEAAKKVGDVIVLPITSFSPGVQQMGAKDVGDPMAFVRHGFQGEHFPSKQPPPKFLFVFVSSSFFLSAPYFLLPDPRLDELTLLQGPGNPRMRGTLAADTQTGTFSPVYLLCTIILIFYSDMPEALHANGVHGSLFRQHTHIFANGG